MSKVLLEMSMSLDGYVTGPDVTAQEPMGRGGERLHATKRRNRCGTTTPEAEAGEVAVEASVSPSGVLGGRAHD